MQVLGDKLGFPGKLCLMSLRKSTEIPFDYKTKFRAVFYENRGRLFCAVAGAPEILMEQAEKYQDVGK